MRLLSWSLLALLGLLAAVPAAAQTRDQKACLVDPPDRNTVAACNRLIEDVNGKIELVRSGKYRPKGETKENVLSRLYNLRGGAYQAIARRHAANEERKKASELHLRAIGDFGEAIRLDPAPPYAYLNRGSSLAETIEHDSALEDFEKVLRIDPDNAKALNNRGGVHRDKGEYKNALVHFNRALELQPTFAYAFFNRGTVHLQKEDYDLAIADYTAAMRHGPKDIDTLAARGRAWREKRDYKRAKADFEAALALPAQDKRSKSVQDAVRELLRAVQEKAARDEADGRRAAREEAERKEAARKQAAAEEAARKEAAQAEAARRRSEAAEAARQEAARREAERQQIARERAEAAEAARREAERADAARREAARRKANEEAAHAEAARKEALRLRAELEEAERQEAARRKEAQEEARRAEAARREAERLKAEREEAERREAARRKEAEEKAARERTRRIALVIGNSAYAPLPQLPNPRNDATGVAEALRALNFQVTTGIDLKHAEMAGMLTRFAEAAGGVDTALLFFAGHGLQDAGINYLAPIDALVEGEKGLGKFIDLQSEMARLSRNPGISILIIDACRNNPLVAKRVAGLQPAQGRSIFTTRGLRRPEIPAGSKGEMFIAFATLPDQVANDGVGLNSPFTRALLAHLLTPGLELRDLFQRVRQEVRTATHGLQIPEDVSRLVSKFYFKAAN